MGRQGGWLRAVASRRRGGRRLDRARNALDVLARVMELSDPATSRHGREIAALVPRVGRMLGFHGDAAEELELAAHFHDIGKVAVPEAVLRKPGPLEPHEWELMACHVEWGAELLRHLPACERIARIVRHHHERYDGSGYPDGLAGNEIPLASRIIATCDAYGAMVSDRPYQRALSPAHALSELRDGAGAQFDPGTVAAVLALTDDSQGANLVAMG